MDWIQMRARCRAFGIQGQLCACETLCGGKINATYHVTTDARGAPREYIVQRLNTHAFPAPHQVMHNILRVTEHLRGKLQRDGRCADRLVLNLLRTADGSAYLTDADGSVWRAYPMITRAVSYPALTDVRLLARAGAAFGGFVRDLLDVPTDTLYETIPDFHNTPKRLDTLFAHAEADPLGRAVLAQAELESLRAGYAAACFPYRLMQAGRMPLRVTHGDTKCSNVLFDVDSGQALAVIDLDTVMPGLLIYDFGDAVRSASCGTGQVDLVRFTALARGFLGALGTAITSCEREQLVTGIYAVTMELAARYLDDFLTGDRYFQTTQPEENLLRTRRQLAVARDVLRHMDALREQIESIEEENI